jgi:hypothetical protein
VQSIISEIATGFKSQKSVSKVSTIIILFAFETSLNVDYNNPGNQLTMAKNKCSECNGDVKNRLLHKFSFNW